MGSDRRSPCPVSCTLDLIGDRWTLLVVRDLHLGKATFKEFLASPEGIATNILTQRLGRLVDAGLVKKRPTPEHSGRFTYTLTAKGRSLLPLLEQIRDWGLEHLKGTRALLG
ncbi:MAG: helix-turn-helix domain-containing protein [Planctomycetota bacterium]